MSVQTEYPHIIFDSSRFLGSKSFSTLTKKYKVNAQCMNPVISFEDSQNLTPFEQTVHTLVLDFYHTEGMDPRISEDIQIRIFEHAIRLFSQSIHSQ
jgi:hypothetical protein